MTRDARITDYFEDSEPEPARENPDSEDEPEPEPMEDTGPEHGTTAPRLQQSGTIRFVHPRHGLTPTGLKVKVTNRGVEGDRPQGYYKPVNSNEHYHRALGAYCISDSALKDARNQSVEYIFIGEKDTDSVYEFTLADYRIHGEEVPRRYGTKGDPQTYVPLKKATEWPNHLPNLIGPI